MALANIPAYAAILKEAYDDSNGVNEQINNEVEVLNFMKKATGEWNGKKYIVPMHVARSGAVANIPDGGLLPSPNYQKTVDLIVTNATVAGRGQISRSLMKAAPSKGAGAFVAALKFEMDQMIEDVVNVCDLRAVSGRTIKGYLNEHKACGAGTTGAFVGHGAANGSSAVFEYAGEFDCFGPNAYTGYPGLTPANTDTWIRCRLIRTNDYSEVLPTLGGGGATVAALFISAYDSEACTITLTLVADAAGATLTTIGAIVTDYGFAVDVTAFDTGPLPQLLDGVGVPFGTVLDTTNEQTGIFGNLSSQTHWTIDRTTATGYPILQATVRTCSTTGPTFARATIAVPRMQSIRDRVYLASKAKAELTWMNPLQRQSYLGITTAQTFYRSNGESKKTDASPEFEEDVTYAGRSIKTARHVPRGLVMFLTGKYWELAEYARGSFIDEDGNILSRVPNHDSMEFAYTWNYNHFCRRPNANGILIGVAL